MDKDAEGILFLTAIIIGAALVLLKLLRNYKLRIIIVLPEKK